MTSQAPEIAIVGAGAFGGALAITLSGTRSVTLWGRSLPPRILPRLPDTPLPDRIRRTDDLAEIRAPIILLALPAQTLRPFLAANRAHLAGKVIVSCAKGIDLTTLTGPSAVISDACPHSKVAVLTGPSFAVDIASGLPTALTLACADAATGAMLQSALSTPTLRLYRTTDVTGAELNGALKNVIAIAAGVAIGAGLGDSARAAVVTRGFSEMRRVAEHLGGLPETLTGLSGLGDLMLTATSGLSRNYRYGLALGAREPFDASLTVEGAATARAISSLADRDGLDLPICAMAAGLSEGQVSVPDAISVLFNRPLKEE